MLQTFTVSFYFNPLKHQERLLLACGKDKKVQAGHFLRKAAELFLPEENGHSEDEVREFFPGDNEKEKTAHLWSLFEAWFSTIPPNAAIRKSFPQKGQKRGWNPDYPVKKFEWPNTPAGAYAAVMYNDPYCSRIAKELFFQDVWLPVIAAWNRCRILPYRGGWLVDASSEYDAACCEALLFIQANRRPKWMMCPNCFRVHDGNDWKCAKCRGQVRRYIPPVERTEEMRFLDRIRRAKCDGIIDEKDYVGLKALVDNGELLRAQERYSQLKKEHAMRKRAASFRR
jgi:hypothetical protein